MEMILSVIADAERRQVTEQAVRLWLRWLKNVAYVAEDTIDEFSYETTRRLLRGNNLKYRARDFFSSANPLAFRFKMARKIKHINKRLDEITKDTSRFYLQTTPASNTSVLLGESNEQRSRQTASYINDSEVIGWEDDKERIINMLTKVIPSSSKSSDRNSEQVSVISIVGMGGLGKTSLAQLVYKDKLVNNHFQQTMWVHVSEDFDVEKHLTKIMESSTLKKFDTLSNLDVLVRKVREQLNGKRYLLVLDDLWNEDAEQWEIFCNALVVGAQGSKILDDVATFKMHDLAEAVVGDHQCLVVKDTDQLENILEVRRLNLMLEEFSTSTKTFSNIKKLRTIIVFGRKYSFNINRLSSNKHLRILHLGDPCKRNSKKKYRKTLRTRQLRYLQISSIYLFGNFPFSRLYNLQTLVLSRCGHVQKHFKEIGSLKHLRHLDMSFSDIQELPDSVWSLHNLQTLDLNHCEKLTTLPDSATGLECLRFLDMSFTPIEKLPDFVTSLPSLRTLDVNTCKKLKTLPEYVAGLKNLRIFNFKGCPLLEALSEDFGGLSQLRYRS
ncbi:putative disease resistance RPP13-like protein 1 [Papaver somniferum]|uniref:putative disease resistance RPP13-like protein 1 n=1 Tax=Papaver somniferum TaxID=3469 RepID=UPI000E7046BB|nr:putative disease resistance RPP13-like protein 1 [Papaver somniferum]